MPTAKSASRAKKCVVSLVCHSKTGWKWLYQTTSNILRPHSRSGFTTRFNRNRLPGGYGAQIRRPLPVLAFAAQQLPADADVAPRLDMLQQQDKPIIQCLRGKQDFLVDCLGCPCHKLEEGKKCLRHIHIYSHIIWLKFQQNSLVRLSASKMVKPSMDGQQCAARVFQELGKFDGRR